MRYSMKIIKKTYGDIANNIFIIYKKDGGFAYIIDPGFAPQELAAELQKHKLTLKGIILTHFHGDHVAACDSLCRIVKAPVMLHEKDMKYIRRCNVDILLKDGDLLDLDGIKLNIIHTPGHSKGSICILDKEGRNAFTGDTIFSTDTGYLIFEGGSGEDMIQSVKKLDPLLTDDYFIYPGHDDCVPMSYVRQHNNEYRDYLNGIIPNTF